MRSLVLAVLVLFSVPALSASPYRYDSGQTLTTIVVDTLNAPSHTIAIPAGRVFTIVGWHGESYLHVTVTIGALGTAGLEYGLSSVAAESYHYSSFVVAGPATITLSNTSKYHYVTVLTYALTRARTANP